MGVLIPLLGMPLHAVHCRGHCAPPPPSGALPPPPVTGQGLISRGSTAHPLPSPPPPPTAVRPSPLPPVLQGDVSGAQFQFAEVAKIRREELQQEAQQGKMGGLSMGGARGCNIANPLPQGQVHPHFTHPNPCLASSLTCAPPTLNLPHLASSQPQHPCQPQLEIPSWQYPLPHPLLLLLLLVPLPPPPLLQLLEVGAGGQGPPPPRSVPACSAAPCRGRV